MFEPIFNSHKIRYDKINELLIENEVELKRNKEVKIFINLDSIFRELCTPNVNEVTKASNSNERVIEMVADIINLAAHYRNYFRKRYVKSKVVIYTTFPYSRLKYKNIIYNSDYKSYFIDKVNSSDVNNVRNIFEQAMPLAKVILEYIENVHLVSSDEIDSSLIPFIYMNKVDTSTSLNVFISKDKYDYQYVNYSSIILRPKKEDSYLVSKGNLIDTIKKEAGIANVKTCDTSFYPFIYAVTGDRYRNIPKIKRVGISSVLNSINQGIKRGEISQTKNNVFILTNLIKEEYRTQLLNNNFSIDLETQYKALNISDFEKIERQLTNKFDNVSLKKINDMYFIQHPIYLVELTQKVENPFSDYKQEQRLFGMR